MKRSLMADIRKIQLIVVFVFAFLALDLVAFIIWTNTLKMNEERLLHITGIIQREILTHPGDFQGNDPKAMEKRLTPLLRNLVSTSPNDLTVGFYSRPLDQVVVAYSTRKNVNLKGTVIPPEHSGRTAWKKRIPVFSFSQFYARPSLVFKCDNPVVLHRKVIGHAFANITFSSLMMNVAQPGLGLLVIILLAGSVAIIFSNRTTNTILRNLDYLLLRKHRFLIPNFDYSELEEIAKTNLQTHKRIEDILESISDAFISINRQWHLTWANERALQIFGREWEDIAGESVWEAFPEHYRAALYEPFSAIFASNVPRHFETLVSDNQWLEVHAFPAEKGLSVYFRDITQQKLYENQIAADRELLLVTLRSIGSGVISTDEKGSVILINELAERLTGYDVAGAVGKPLKHCFYIMDDRTSEPYDWKISAVLTSGSVLSVEKAVLVTYDLHEIFISFVCAPILEPGGKTLGMVIVFNDITEKLRLQEEFLRTEKLESVGILAGGIAHDFNNILAALLSNLQLIQLKLANQEDVGVYLEDTVKTVHRASDLTKQLLTFSQGGSPVKKAASLTELIRETADFALRGAAVKLETSFDDDLWPAEIDTGQISQVIHNLVINAKQAMPKGGLIRIQVVNFRAEPGGRYHPGRYVKITIQDQGTGISPEIVGKIFDPFFTTKQGGTGLGLATSYSIIRQHDGYLEVKSEPGVGTSFFAYLPATSETIPADEERQETAATADGLRILLMDDEDSIRQVVEEMLEYFGYHVTSCRDGNEAIALYKQAMVDGAPFDAVIMDLTIPGGMGGQETIAILRDFDPSIKAIVTSGYINDLVIAEYERFGFRGVVAKPYDFDELHRMLDRVVRGDVVDPE